MERFGNQRLKVTLYLLDSFYLYPRMCVKTYFSCGFRFDHAEDLVLVVSRVVMKSFIRRHEWKQF